MNILSNYRSSFAFLLVLLFGCNIYSYAHAKDENSVIIATVDNVKGLIDMNSVQSICNDFIYDDFKFIGIPGELNMYNKDCVCVKYKQFKQLPLQSSELFMKLIRDCKLNITLQSLENATQNQVIKETGGYTVPDPDVETEEEIDKIQEEIDLSDKITVFPNPVNTFFTISYSVNQPISDIKLVIYDAIGKEVTFSMPDLKTDVGQHEIKIDISHLQKGLYFYNFTRNGQQYTGRLYKS